eukprot:16324-Prymnesium_polylepis.1
MPWLPDRTHAGAAPIPLVCETCPPSRAAQPGGQPVVLFAGLLWALRHGERPQADVGSGREAIVRAGREGGAQHDGPAARLERLHHPRLLRK